MGYSNKQTQCLDFNFSYVHGPVPFGSVYTAQQPVFEQNYEIRNSVIRHEHDTSLQTIDTKIQTSFPQPVITRYKKHL